MGGSSAENDIENVVFANVTVTHGPHIYPNLNRTEAFPGLLQPIHDRFVPQGMVVHNYDDFCPFCLIMGLCNAVVVVLLLLEVCRPTRRSENPDANLQTPLLSPAEDAPRTPSPRRSSVMRLFTGLLLLLMIDVLAWQVKKWSTPKWDRTDKYFRCTGVANGTATNGTWPVPGCFTEM